RCSLRLRSGAPGGAGRRGQNFQGSRARSLATISLPNGASATGIIFSEAHAIGMPMMVTARPIAVAMWPRVSHQPATMSQMMFPTVLGAPAPDRLVIVRPKIGRAHV